MPEPSHNYTKLPGRLRDELGLSTIKDRGSRGLRNGPSTRKAQRKAARIEKKKAPPKARAVRVSQNSEHAVLKQTSMEQYPAKSKIAPEATPKSILKRPKSHSTFSRSPSPQPQISRKDRKRLEDDDNEIAALEKALGMKNKVKLPKAFEQDGLDDLLEGLDDVVADNDGRKRKNAEGDDWLQKKREKADDNRQRGPVDNPLTDDDDSDQTGFSDSDGDLEVFEKEHDLLIEDDNSDEEPDFPDSEDEEISTATEDEAPSRSAPANVPKRENPYVAPVTASSETASAKYIPPSMRSKDPARIDGDSRLRRQMQGLLNRLSEANLLSISRDFENLYQNHPRQQVSAGILDLLVGLLSDPSLLQDTFIILHAGLIAALYKIMGTEFGALAVERIEKEFSLCYHAPGDAANVDKRLINLVNVLAELYNFQVISSTLIFDFVRLFLEDLSETNTELLLKIVRNAGTQLRQDDPSALKDIASMLQGKVIQSGEKSVSVRIRFMLETINNLKNNRMKTGVAASSVSMEHTIRMKKTLGTLNQRSIVVSEPLRFGLKDLQDTHKRGKWWLVGGTYRDPEQDLSREEILHVPPKTSPDEVDVGLDITEDLATLAKDQRMNTDVRRSIFIAVMSAADYNDAYMRLMKLRLKKSQELEIPKVLIHCSGSEAKYNPFYALLSRRVCSDRKLKMAFQFSLWDIFKQMEDADDNSDSQDSEEQADGLNLRKTVNLARMFGSLIADGGLGLGVLKNLNLVYLPRRTRIFVEIMLITVMLQSQKSSNGVRNEKSLLDIFTKPKEMPEIARSMRYFIKKVIMKSDLTGDQKDSECVRWACKTASEALIEMAE